MVHHGKNVTSKVKWSPVRKNVYEGNKKTSHLLLNYMLSQRVNTCNYKKTFQRFKLESS